MKTTFNFTRLGIGLREFYYLYRKDFRTMALLVFILAILGNLYPTSIFYEHIMRDSKETLSIDTAFKLISGKSVTFKQLIFIPGLLVIPVIFQYIKRIRTIVSRNLLPLSAWENTMVPILGTFVMLLVLFSEIYLLDTAIAQIYRQIFFKDAMELLAQNGQLYPYMDPYAYFNPIPLSFYLFSFSKLIVISIVVMIGLLSIWKINFLGLVGIFALIGGIYLVNMWLSVRTYNSDITALTYGSSMIQMIYQLFLLIIGLYTIKQLFKEGQV